MSFTLSELMQHAILGLGRAYSKTVVATAGGTGIFNASALSEQDYQDDHFNNWWAFVAYDAAGAGAAPQGEFYQVSDYSAPTKLFTLSANPSVNIAAGDYVLLVKPTPFSIPDVKTVVNNMLQELGEVPIFDTTSLVTVDGQSEYTLPIGFRPSEILVQTNTESGDNQWITLSDWDAYPATTGTGWTLRLSDRDGGYKIGIKYRGFHPQVMDYNDAITEYVPRPVLISMATWYLAKWFNLDMTQELERRYQNRLSMNPWDKEVQRVGGFPHWSAN